MSILVAIQDMKNAVPGRRGGNIAFHLNFPSVFSDPHALYSESWPKNKWIVHMEWIGSTHFAFCILYESYLEWFKVNYKETRKDTETKQRMHKKDLIHSNHADK